MQLKRALLEVNFTEGLVVLDGDRAIKPKEEVWEEKIVNNLYPLWNDPEKDEIEYFIYYSDQSYLCQKRRRKVDFANNSYFWAKYQFTDANKEQAEQLYLMFLALATAEQEEKKIVFGQSTLEFFDRELYYERKYIKMRKEIAAMLQFSDWRMTVDYEEEFDGEQEMWKNWRAALRRLVPDYDTFETPFEAFKAVSMVKYPIDPNNYFRLYPDGKDVDGNPVEYMSTDDQFTKLDFLASGDFAAFNVEAIVDFFNEIVEEEIVIEQKVLEVMDQLELYNYYPELKKRMMKMDPNYELIPEPTETILQTEE